MADLPFGIDVSKWQGKVDWDVVAAHSPKVEFCGIRASISNGYTDTWFARNWADSKRVGIPRTAYHVVYPGVAADSQINHFLKVVGNDVGELPLTLDVELDHGLHYSKIAACILQCCTLITSSTGKKPLIYSRAMWIDQYVTGSGQNPPGWLNDYDWWIALYKNTADEHPGPPTLPKGVDRARCKIHQTSQKGTAFGVETKQLDYNRWQGDLANLKAYIGQSYTPIPTPTKTLEERVAALEAEARRHGWSI